MANEKKLGFGLMRLPIKGSNQKDIDMEQFKNMVDLFLERGFDYFDTSYVYHDGESENAVRKALVERHDRGSYRLASKFPAFMGFHTDEEIKKVFQEQLDKCGVEYFDYYLIHSLNRELYDNVKDTPLFNLAIRWRAEGKIRHLGLSWHDNAEELDRVLNEHPEIEFVQIVVNYYDWDEPLVQSRECYEVIRKHGCEVIAMESVKGGMLAAVPKEAKLQMQLAHPDWSPAIWALQYAANLDGMITVLSGMSTLAQVEDNTRGMQDTTPFTTLENSVIKATKDAFMCDWKIQCTDWRKMDESTPNGVPVSAVIRAYNTCMLQADPTFTADLNYYYLFKNYCGDPDFEEADYSNCTKALGGELDVNAAVKEATDFMLKYGFK